MNGTLVDSNVLLDIFTNDPAWADWSATALQRAVDSGPLYVNPIVYAEISIGFESIEELDAELSPQSFIRLNLPWEAAFLAGKAFIFYRRQGGTRQAVLPDFFIGAHAAISGLDLLTRDATRYRTYFPSVTLISPE